MSILGGGCLIAPGTNYAKEITKWEAHPTAAGPGLRPYVKRDFPMMLHLAGRPAGDLGKSEIIDTCIAESERDVQRMRASGFRMTPNEAMEAFDAQQLEFATLAAERNADRVLSDKARAEVAQVEAKAGAVHLPTIPQKNLRKE